MGRQLVATKLRALYQRKKGRDLYDLWLALTVQNLNPNKILEAFPAYRPEGTRKDFLIENLLVKLKDKEFCTDINGMLRVGSPDYDPQVAGKLVINTLLSFIV